MLFRFATFIIAVCAVTATTFFVFPSGFSPVGALLGGLLWLAWDTWRAEHFDAALRVAQTGQELPSYSGWWGRKLDRVRRMLRNQQQLNVASEQRMTDFLAAIQASPNGVLLLDSQNRIEWCNQTAAQQLGLNAQRDVLQHIGNLVRQPDFARYLTGNEFDHEVVFPATHSTSHRPLKVSVQLHPYGEGRKLMLTRDVTALEQAEAQRRDFVANVSHEIRTPLTVLSGFVETLQNLPLDEGQRKRYLDLMAQQSQRMQALVSDLLTLSRLEGSPVPSMVDTVSIRSLLDQCEQDARALMQTLRNASTPQPLRLHFDYADEASAHCALLGASNELMSAMGNLINNAVRYTPIGGRIDVMWALLPSGVGQLSVSDTGPGIAAEHLPRLTERFYRVDRSRSRDTGGTGLGLAIAKHVAQRHDGELRIESVEGQGSTFHFAVGASRIRVG
jgi:two-component system, OmpR family, phosphate regulon sensor histidine kinase PhoR